MKELENNAEGKEAYAQEMRQKFPEAEEILKEIKSRYEYEDEEYKIIEHVKEHFGNIQQEIETLVATSEENSATIQNITDTITSQNDSIRSISAEIDEISSLSADLEQHFWEDN